MVKIRAANKSGTLEVSLATGMKSMGYVNGAEADWQIENGAWVLKLRPNVPSVAVEATTPPTEVQA